MKVDICRYRSAENGAKTVFSIRTLSRDDTECVVIVRCSSESDGQSAADQFGQVWLDAPGGIVQNPDQICKAQNHAGPVCGVVVRDAQLLALVPDGYSLQVFRGGMSIAQYGGGKSRSLWKRLFPTRSRIHRLQLRPQDSFLLCSDAFGAQVCCEAMIADRCKTDCARTWMEYLLRRALRSFEKIPPHYFVVCGIVQNDIKQEDSKNG